MIYIEREVEEEMKIVGIGNRGVGMEFKDGGFFFSFVVGLGFLVIYSFAIGGLFRTREPSTTF